MKRILTIQDLSCLGKCSLTVALPIISAIGIETTVIPTSLLSTHSGFEEFVFHDLTKQIKPIANHFQRENIPFQGIYTGYLGSREQVKIVKELIRRFKREDTKIIVDPVMGDKGKLYSNFGQDFPAAMLELCKEADYVLPNLTEVAYLLDEPFLNNYNEQGIREALIKLNKITKATIIITGVSLKKNCLGVMGIDAKSKNIFYRDQALERGTYHGTGDIFASVLSGLLIKGYALEEAASLAMKFVCQSIQATDPQEDERLGVSFERVLKLLTEL